MKERKSHVFMQQRQRDMRRVLSVSPAGLQIVQRLKYYGEEEEELFTRLSF